MVSASSGASPKAASAAPSTKPTPSRLVAKASESSAVIVSPTAAGAPSPTAAATSRSTPASASRSRQTSNGREAVRSGPAPAHAALVLAPPTSRPSTPVMPAAPLPGFAACA